MAVKVGPLFAIAGGAVFIYAGLRGYSVLKAAQNIIRGDPPQTGQSIAALAEETSGGFAGTPSASAFANNAQKYVGKLRYVYGGPPPMGTVDCSSFASKVLAESGVENPGGAKYDPRTHGPTTLSYLSWNGAQTVGHHGQDAMPGDLCVWQTHMGIAIGGGQMVSARSAGSTPNVGIDTIEGDKPGEFLYIRRVK